jgi:hypothetical protein
MISQTKVPQLVSFSAVVRNANNTPLANTSVSLRLTFRKLGQTGPVVYCALHQQTTNANGYITLQLNRQVLGIACNGAPSTAFENIPWEEGGFWMDVEYQTTPTSPFVNLGQLELASTFYSFVSKYAENVKGLSLGTANNDDVLTYESATNTWKAKPVSNTVGPQGPAGPAGAQGSQGIAGSAGNNGIGITNTQILNDSLKITLSNNTTINAGYVKGAKGDSGLNSLIKTTTINAGSICFNGGIKLEVGIDINKNNVLDSIEINPAQTKYICGYNDTSKGVPPSVITGVSSNLGPQNVTISGIVTNIGSEILLSKGFCIDTVSNLSLEKAIPFGTINQSKSPWYQGISNLIPNKKYYAKAYATNNKGTSFGDTISFTTPSATITPVVNITNINSVTYTSASISAMVISDGGSTVTSRGICWAKTVNPTIADSFLIIGSGLGSYNSNISNLSNGTKYYVRAYATNAAGTSYSSTNNFFTTNAYTLPIVSTKTLYGLTTTTINSGGMISDSGGTNITNKGIVWDTLPNPTILKNLVSNGVNADSFNTLITGLQTGKTYYFRAFATNSVGTAYGAQLSIFNSATIPPNPTVPIVGTTSNNIMTTQSTASSGGYVSSSGGSPVTARGVCWSTSPNPTINNSKTTNGTGVGFFTSNITGLSGCGITYYIRAYATNANGTGYGAEYSLNTGVLASNNIPSISNITINSAFINANITSDGGCPITQRGICWSIKPNPKLSDSTYWFTSNGSGIGTFSDTMIGLGSNVKYYVRSYAINSIGVSYGPIDSFTTLTPNSHYIGESFGGGIISYIDGTGNHGLIVADVNTKNYNSYDWDLFGCSGINISTDTSIGSGLQNTTNIIAAACPPSPYGSFQIISPKSAYICDTFNYNGFSDWYLPSINELMTFKQLVKIGKGNIYTTYPLINLPTPNNFYTNQKEHYQSSSQYDLGSNYILTIGEKLISTGMMSSVGANIIQFYKDLIVKDLPMFSTSYNVISRCIRTF